jgi:hypothetical protein
VAPGCRLGAVTTQGAVLITLIGLAIQVRERNLGFALLK